MRAQRCGITLSCVTATSMFNLHFQKLRACKGVCDARHSCVTLLRVGKEPYHWCHSAEQVLFHRATALHVNAFEAAEGAGERTFAMNPTSIVFSQWKELAESCMDKDPARRPTAAELIQHAKIIIDGIPMRETEAQQQSRYCTVPVAGAFAPATFPQVHVCATPML